LQSGPIVGTSFRGDGDVEDAAEPTELDAAEGDIISSAMQGVDCPYCEDTTEHKHSEEDVAHLRASL